MEPVHQPMHKLHDKCHTNLGTRMQELRGEREAKPVEHLSLPRGISLSRSDLTSLPDGADRSTSAVRPVDAWPAMPPLDSRTAAGVPAQNLPDLILARVLTSQSRKICMHQL